MNERNPIEEVLEALFRFLDALFRLTTIAVLWLVYMLPGLVAGCILAYGWFLFPKASEIFFSRSAFPMGGMFGLLWIAVNLAILLLAIVVIGGIGFAINWVWGKGVERLYSKFLPEKLLSLWKAQTKRGGGG